MISALDKEKVAEENIRLVYKVVSKFRNTHFDYDDILSAGMFGFNNAINAYDSDGQVKFSTFAYTCIKNEIYLFMNEQRMDKRKANNEASSLDVKARSNAGGSTTREVSLKNIIPNPESEYDWEGINEAVEMVFKKLTDKQRVVFSKFLEDKKQDDIAKELGRTKQAVSVMVLKVLKMVKEEYWRGV